MGTSNFVAQVQDSENPPLIAQSPPVGHTGQLGITINAAITNSLLTGNYLIVFNGFKNGTPFIMVGSIITDGNGNITGGKLDYNDGTGEPNDPSQCHSNPLCPIPQTIQSPGSTYDLSAGNGLGNMTISTLDNSGNPHTYTFSISVSGSACTANQYVSSCGRLIENDAQMYGSGELKVQDPSYFPVNPFFPGNFAVQLLGIDPGGNRYAAAGAIGFNPTTGVDVDCNGNGWHLTNCPLDANDNGNSGSGATISDPFRAASPPTSTAPRAADNLPTCFSPTILSEAVLGRQTVSIAVMPSTLSTTCR